MCFSFKKNNGSILVSVISCLGLLSLVFIFFTQGHFSRMAFYALEESYLIGKSNILKSISNVQIDQLPMKFVYDEGVVYVFKQDGYIRFTGELYNGYTVSYQIAIETVSKEISEQSLEE